jgi:hypothetical protein
MASISSPFVAGCIRSCEAAVISGGCRHQWKHKSIAA